AAGVDAGDLQVRDAGGVPPRLRRREVDRAGAKVPVGGQRDVAGGGEIEAGAGVEVVLLGKAAEQAIAGRHVESLHEVDDGAGAVVAEEVDAAHRLHAAVGVGRVEILGYVEGDGVRRRVVLDALESAALGDLLQVPSLEADEVDGLRANDALRRSYG